jgi:DNA replication protein DnaD
MDIFKLKSLMPTQKEYVNYWHDNDYPLEIVQYLYNKYDALDKQQALNDPKAPKKNQANIFYINKIIQNLLENKVTTMDALKRYEQSHDLDATHKTTNDGYYRKKNTSPKIETNYDLDEFRTFIHATKRIMHD